MALRIERYRNTRHWAVYDEQELVVVTLYKCGAQEVRRRLEAQPLAGAEAAAVEAAARQARTLARQAQAAAQAAQARAQPTRRTSRFRGAGGHPQG